MLSKIASTLYRLASKLNKADAYLSFKPKRIARNKAMRTLYRKSGPNNEGGKTKRLS